MVWSEEEVEGVADQLTYWPQDIGLFSTSGCKKVSQKVDLLLEERDWDTDEL